MRFVRVVRLFLLTTALQMVVFLENVWVEIFVSIRALIKYSLKKTYCLFISYNVVQTFNSPTKQYFLRYDFTSMQIWTSLL